MPLLGLRAGGHGVRVFLDNDDGFGGDLNVFMVFSCREVEGNGWSII